jgi:4-diphosphocytidyl-2-C-methyl-D-erythritol kinase
MRVKSLSETSKSMYTIEAPAKINLTLEVLGKRPDGYHEIRSVI